MSLVAFHLDGEAAAALREAPSGEGFVIGCHYGNMGHHSVRLHLGWHAAAPFASHLAILVIEQSEELCFELVCFGVGLCSKQ